MVASKALAKALADLVIITNADAVAAKGGTMNGDDIKAAVHAVFIAVPGQACTRTSIKDKAQGLAFLSALPASWITLLAPARVACMPSRPPRLVWRTRPPLPRQLLRTTSPPLRPRSYPLGP